MIMAMLAKLDPSYAIRLTSHHASPHLYPSFPAYLATFTGLPTEDHDRLVLSQDLGSAVVTSSGLSDGQLPYGNTCTCKKSSQGKEPRTTGRGVGVDMNFMKV